ncbi:MAG: hypothetical protein ACREUD_06645 [Gammaproteobacteria bacterium]
MLGTSSFALAAGQYYFVEFKATVHNTSGSVEVRVNGISRLSGNNAGSCVIPRIRDQHRSATPVV